MSKIVQKIKDKVGHRGQHGDGDYDNTLGATTGYDEAGIVGERPVAVGVAEVPVVVTEQERATHHEHHQRATEEVCGQKTFTEVEDRPVVRERVERIVEHKPVEKQYVVETRFVGERAHGVAGAEIVDVKDRVVDVAAPGPACPANAGAVMNEVVGGVAGGTGTHDHHHHTGAHTGATDRL